MGEVIMFPGVKDNLDDAVSTAAIARSYGRWRLMNPKKYEEFRASLLEAIDDKHNMGSMLVSLTDAGGIMVQCDISSDEAIEHLKVAITLLEKKS